MEEFWCVTQLLTSIRSDPVAGWTVLKPNAAFTIGPGARSRQIGPDVAMLDDVFRRRFAVEFDSRVPEPIDDQSSDRVPSRSHEKPLTVTRFRSIDLDVGFAVIVDVTVDGDVAASDCG